MSPGNGSSISQRARSGSAVDGQDGLFDKQWSDDGLEAALEERERIREQRADVNAQYKTADKDVKDQLARFELAVGEVARIGRFRIKKTRRAGSEVSFETAPREQLTIGLIDDGS